MAKINLKNWEKAIKNTRGIITTIARNLDVDRVTVYKFLKKNKKARQMLEDEKEKVYDVAESVLYQKLAEKDMNAVRLLLLNNKRGRERGYGESREVNMTGDITQNIDKVKLEIIDGSKHTDKQDI
jgi:undecaprenyl pyrophosphate synthase